MNTNPIIIGLLLTSSLSAPLVREQPVGCCRVYVCLLEKKDKKAVKAACKLSGKMFLDKAYGAGPNVIYVGYDNCSGEELARATNLVKVLKNAGISCYRDVVGD